MGKKLAMAGSGNSAQRGAHTGTRFAPVHWKHSAKSLCWVLLGRSPAQWLCRNQGGSWGWQQPALAQLSMPEAKLSICMSPPAEPADSAAQAPNPRSMCYVHA